MKPDDSIVVTLKGDEQIPLIFTIVATCIGALLTIFGIIMMCSYYTTRKNKDRENVTLEVDVIRPVDNFYDWGLPLTELSETRSEETTRAACRILGLEIEGSELEMHSA